MKRQDAGTRERQNERGGRFRREWLLTLFCFLLATALPALTALACGLAPSPEEDGLTEESLLLLCHHSEDRAEELTLERLLTLSLAATNSSDTPTASLEAQAILLRSRAVWWLDYCQGEGKEQTARDALPTLCDSATHGLPYLSEAELIDLLGDRETKERIAASLRAVTATRGQVVCYEGEVVPALLHNSSSGETRSVESLPWLSAVSSPEEGTVTVLRVPAEEARTALAAGFGLLLSASPAEWAVTLDCETGGAVNAVTIEETILPGASFASALSLPSCSFTMETAEDALVFTCTGIGSGCGLSREGAAIYARGGLSFTEILAHYYPDCTLEQAWE